MHVAGLRMPPLEVVESGRGGWVLHTQCQGRGRTWQAGANKTFDKMLVSYGVMGMPSDGGLVCRGWLCEVVSKTRLWSVWLLCFPCQKSCYSLLGSVVSVDTSKGQNLYEINVFCGRI